MYSPIKRLRPLPESTAYPSSGSAERQGRSGMSGADAAGGKSGDVAEQYLKGIREAALAKHGPHG